MSMLHAPALARECRRRPNRREDGFALILAVSLLALMVLLVVGLATLTRIETSVADIRVRQAQARANALTALNIALGQLQKAAGPDQRVTATAEAFGGVAGTRHYTGVWDSTGSGKEPLLWLVSGSESGKVDATTAPSDAVELVGAGTSGVAGDVLVRRIPLPAAAAGAEDKITGHYAWWVGDEGVKAPVGLTDPTLWEANFDYRPFKDSPETLSRIRQQISLGGGPFDLAGSAASYEPRAEINAPLIGRGRVMTPDQLAFLKSEATVEIGPDTIRRMYHAWTSDNANVLASTNAAVPGLRRDLSLRPDLLGAGFEHWARYHDYMESVSEGAANSVRRRYRMTRSVEEKGIEHRVAPVLSFFGLSFSLHNDKKTNSPTKLLASARCVVELWNPYTSALVPEDLFITVRGLPEVTVKTETVERTVDLQNLFGFANGAAKFSLKFAAKNSDPDRSSWLPGRVYCWSAVSSQGAPGDEGFLTNFYQRDATPTGGSGVEVDAGLPIGPNTVSAIQQYRQCSVTSEQTLVIELHRASDGETLARFVSPRFHEFQTGYRTFTPSALKSDFAYVFRLPDQFEVLDSESGAWLQAEGRDVREVTFAAGGRTGYFPAGGHDLYPPLFVSPNNAGFPASYSHLLLDRYPAGKSYNEDAPVFELPRAPLVSLGSLQHLHLVNRRPFAVGNSWGGALNQWFDAYYFSGLTAETKWNDITRPLPNAGLKVLRRWPDSTPVTPEDVRREARRAGGPPETIRGEERQSDALSSVNLMQTAAFNLNSMSEDAWVAVLRGVRFVAPNGFRFASLNPSTGAILGAAPDATTALEGTLLDNSRIACFPRFGQSAQETFQADEDYVQSDPDLRVKGTANTPLFRRGLRILSAEQVAALARELVGSLRARAAAGPCRTMQEFLSPALVGNAGVPVSLLERAVEQAQVNTDEALGLEQTPAEFSSQWLTQGDIMTALAPVLFPRSDTFVIRAYGDVPVPGTKQTVARAWCEARVQRLPEPFQGALAGLPQDEDYPIPPGGLGRRFKIIAFKWLTQTGI